MMFDTLDFNQYFEDVERLIKRITTVMDDDELQDITANLIRSAYHEALVVTEFVNPAPEKPREQLLDALDNANQQTSEYLLLLSDAHQDLVDTPKLDEADGANVFIHLMLYITPNDDIQDFIDHLLRFHLTISHLRAYVNELIDNKAIPYKEKFSLQFSALLNSILDNQSSILRQDMERMSWFR